MKYVRTKEELGIEREDGTCCFKNWVAYFNSSLKEDWLYADTIEELCDSEVIVWNDSTPSIWNKFLTKQEFEHLYSSFQRKKIIAVYGAIWTYKGLIYVAKINDKGKLELL